MINLGPYLAQLQQHLYARQHTVFDPRIVDLVRATREHPALRFGASPRAANRLAAAARVAAVLDDRDYVLPDDVKSLWKPLMRHRVILSPTAEVDGVSADQALDQILLQIKAPR